MNSYSEAVENDGTTRRTVRGVNSASSLKRVTGDARGCSTNTSRKRRRGSALPAEDVRHQDDDKLLQRQRRRKRTRGTNSPGQENMMECAEDMGRQIQRLQLEVRLLQSRVAELESDSGVLDRVTNRSHLCPVFKCGKSFSTHQHLRRHIKDESSHAHKEFASTLDRTFCDLCQKPFNRSEDYTRHEKCVHPEVFERRHAWTNWGPGEQLSRLNVVSDEEINFTVSLATDEKASATDITRNTQMETSYNAEGSSLLICPKPGVKRSTSNGHKESSSIETQPDLLDSLADTQAR